MEQRATVVDGALVAADAECRHGDVVHVMDVLRSAHVERVSVGVEPD